jgi:hypothetical protein
MIPSNLNITISDARAIDGWVEAANRAGVTPEVMALELLQQQGMRYADLFGIGVLITAAFVRRFTPAEYLAIFTAAAENIHVEKLVTQLIDEPYVSLDDPRLLRGLQFLAAVNLLLPERIAKLLAYDRPQVACYQSATGLAQACHLPQAFIDAISPP